MTDGAPDPDELARRRERDERERNELASLADERERQQLDLQHREQAADDRAAAMERRLGELGDHVAAARPTDREAYELEHWGRKKPHPDAADATPAPDASSGPDDEA